VTEATLPGIHFLLVVEFEVVSKKLWPLAALSGDEVPRSGGGQRRATAEGGRPWHANSRMDSYPTLLLVPCRQIPPVLWPASVTIVIHRPWAWTICPSCRGDSRVQTLVQRAVTDAMRTSVEVLGADNDTCDNLGLFCDNPCSRMILCHWSRLPQHLWL